MNCYVYLAPALGEGRFKVGISTDPKKRLSDFYEEFDLKQVRLVECDAISHARDLERTILWMYRSHRVLPHDLAGHSEWLSAECWNDVLTLIQEHRLGAIKTFERKGARGPGEHVPARRDPAVNLRMARELRSRVAEVVPTSYSEHATIIALVELGLQAIEGDPSPVLRVLKEGSARRVGRGSRSQGE